MTEIDALLQENRKFPPSDEFQSAARSSPTRRSTTRTLRGLLGRAGGGARVVHEVERRCSTGSRRTRKWFVGGKLNVSVNCLDRHIATARAQQGGAHLGRRAGRPAHAHLLGPLRRGPEVRERAQVARREAGRPRRDLHAADPRSRDRDARVRAHRRDPLGGVRRLLARVAARPHQRRAGKVLITADGGYRRGSVVPLKRNADKALEECAVDRARRRRAAPRPARPATKRSPR